MNRIYADAENKYKEEQKRLENEKSKATNAANQPEKNEETKPENKMDVE